MRIFTRANTYHRRRLDTLSMRDNPISEYAQLSITAHAQSNNLRNESIDRIRYMCWFILIRVLSFAVPRCLPSLSIYPRHNTHTNAISAQSTIYSTAVYIFCAIAYKEQDAAQERPLWMHSGHTTALMTRGLCQLDGHASYATAASSNGHITSF